MWLLWDQVQMMGMPFKTLCHPDFPALSPPAGPPMSLCIPAVQPLRGAPCDVRATSHCCEKPLSLHRLRKLLFHLQNPSQHLFLCEVCPDSSSEFSLPARDADSFSSPKCSPSFSLLASSLPALWAEPTAPDTQLMTRVLKQISLHPLHLSPLN